jgi:hypothetical protein
MALMNSTMRAQSQPDSWEGEEFLTQKQMFMNPKNLFLAKPLRRKERHKTGF